MRTVGLILMAQTSLLAGGPSAIEEAIKLYDETAYEASLRILSSAPRTTLMRSFSQERITSNSTTTRGLRLSWNKLYRWSPQVRITIYGLAGHWAASGVVFGLVRTPVRS